MANNYSYHINNITQAAHYILQNVGNAKVIAFTATMGMGKTTLINELCKQLQVIDVISSPTFSIINEYKTATNQTVYHLDLYRVKDVEEAIQAGVEDVLYSGNYCFVEWSQVANDILPEDTIFIEIKMISETEREIFLTSN
jgi:tRNA threonylcarbamoyladenosine biosynthesis protein TsaE